jgi:CO/xanthine dehydrogenase Mo-binding subunit
VTEGAIVLKETGLGFIGRTGLRCSLICRTVTSVQPLSQQSRYVRHTHTAIFVEARVDEDLGSVEVSRCVMAVAGGPILNPKTARSQIMGGIVWGIGIALEEESVIDQTNYSEAQPQSATFSSPLRDLVLLARLPAPAFVSL